jgi:hypothetical protein
MANYILAYRGGRKPATLEEGAAGMAKWKTWLGDLGDDVVIPGQPLGKSMIVSASGVSDDAGPTPLTGYTVVRADSLDAALEMAKSCPFLDMGDLEVAEMIEMKM